MTVKVGNYLEYVLLGVLALLWGASYLFIKIAVAEIPPITLIAARVTIAAMFLLGVSAIFGQPIPNDLKVWGMLFIQAFFNSIGAWTVLAWGQQFVGAGLASVLNSTSPVFVFFLVLFFSQCEAVSTRKLSGVILGVTGVIILVGFESLDGLGDQVLGQLACLAGAALYACAAIYGKRFNFQSALTTATGTMICASVCLVPAALVIEDPWTLNPSNVAIGSTLVLSVFCTGVALLLYFRLLTTIGSLGVASQAYLRSGVGVLLGVFILGESLDLAMVFGLAATITGVALINWPVSNRGE